MSPDVPIPLELLLSGRELTEPRPSPDGRHVALVQRLGGRASIVLVPVHGGPERLVAAAVDPAPGRGLGGGSLAWSPDGASLLVAGADGEVWEVGLAGRSRRLTHAERSVRAPCATPDGRAVVVAVDEAEIWMVDRVDGSTTRLDDGSDAFCADPAVDPSGRHVTWQAWSPPDMPWDGAVRVTVELATGAVTRDADGAVQQPRFLPDGRAVDVRDGTGWLNVSIEGRPVVDEEREHAGPTWGMGQRSYAPSPDGTRVAFTRNEAGFGRLCVAELATGAVESLGRGVHGQIEWVGERISALRSGARTPTHVVVYDLDEAERTVLAVGPASAWSEIELPEPEVVGVDHDGVTLWARRYAAGQGRLLCCVHGGPTDQWPVTFHARTSYWWSRGWDVLVVDPRGTTGHGRAYQRALNGAWGRLDVDDTAALLRHAREQGWAEPSRTAALGSSSGGLTVLGLMADHPDLCAAAVSSYPVSDLRALADVTHRFEAHYTDTLVGPRDDVARFQRLSPLSRAERIRGPLLVFHGTDDPVVPIDQSRALAAAIRAAGGDVELIEFEDEGHGFRDPANVRIEYERTERFLDAAVHDPPARG